MDDLTLKIHNYNAMVFDAIFQPKPPERRVIITPASVLVEERRKVNIATVCNHTEECLRRIVTAGECTCTSEEEFFADRATWLSAGMP